MSLKSNSTPETYPFEAALESLSKIVDQLEKGDLTLEQSLSQFEQGVALTRQAQVALQAAEQKVQILLSTENSPALADFAHEATNE